MISRVSNKNVQALGVIMKKRQGCTKSYLGNWGKREIIALDLNKILLQPR